MRQRQVRCVFGITSAHLGPAPVSIWLGYLYESMIVSDERNSRFHFACESTEAMRTASPNFPTSDNVQLDN